MPVVLTLLGFLVSILAIYTGLLASRVDRLEAAIRELNPGLDI